MPKRPTAFDVRSTFVHFGLGAVAVPLEGFSWEQEYLERYQRETELDGAEGRLLSVTPHTASWESWERHPAGDELVLVLSGLLTLVQEIEGAEHRITLGPMQAVINPRDVWHTADVLEVGEALYLTPGLGTQKRLRAPG
ncbi:MAG TPA: cupin [Acidimicrobiales bacterium]|nr:cupin [Acidimicrobiales bacterium]